MSKYSYRVRYVFAEWVVYVTDPTGKPFANYNGFDCPHEAATWASKLVAKLTETYREKSRCPR